MMQIKTRIISGCVHSSNNNLMKRLAFGSSYCFRLVSIIGIAPLLYNVSLLRSALWGLVLSPPLECTCKVKIHHLLPPQWV